VIVQTLQCPGGVTEVPSIAAAPASEYPNLQYKDIDAEREAIGKAAYQLDLSLPQGNYFFRVQSQHCTQFFQTSVIDGHQRTMFAALVDRNPKAIGNGNFKLFDLENALAGTVAVHPSAAFIVDAHGGKRVLDVQDGAYYIDRLSPGEYTIRLEMAGGGQSEISVDLSSLAASGFLRKDLGLVEIRRHLGVILQSGATRQACYWCF
jgi:hypothetical protein